MVETAGGITDPTAYRQAVARCRELAIVLPTFAELADPSSLDVQLLSQLIGIDPDAPDPRNLYRVHWYNGADRRSLVPVPSHLVLPPELTGVPATIVVALVLLGLSIDTRVDHAGGPARLAYLLLAAIPTSAVGLAVFVVADRAHRSRRRIRHREWQRKIN